MSDPVGFLINDVAVKHYCGELLRKSFHKWKMSLSKFNVVPSSSSSLISACFTWIRRSFSNLGNEDTPIHLFPFYAAIEGDKEESAYFISRLRGFMIDKLEVPAHNLPLLVHAVAMYDVHQLTRFFCNWRNYYFECRRLDQYALVRKQWRVLTWWKRRTNQQIATRHSFSMLRRKNVARCTRAAFFLWHGLLQAIQFRRDVLAPRTARACLMQLVRHRVIQQYQRTMLHSGIRFDMHKRLLWACHTWIRRLNTLPTVATTVLYEWLLSLIRRNWLESQQLRDIYISAFGSRSQFFRCHRFISCLAQAHVHAAVQTGLLEEQHRQRSSVTTTSPDTATATSTPTRHRHHYHSMSSPNSSGGGRGRAVEHTSSRQFRFSTPVRSSSPMPPGAHVSFNTIPQYEPAAYSSGTLHSSVLDATLFSPPTEVRTASRLRAQSPADDALSAYAAQSSGRQTTSIEQAGQRRAFASPSMRMGTGLQSSRSGTPTGNRNGTERTTPQRSSDNANGMPSMLHHQNLASRLAQGVLKVIARQFRCCRSLLVALRRWMHRVPQIKLDSPHTFAIFFARHGQQQHVLQNLVVRCASMLHRPAHYYLVHKLLSHALRKWLYRVQRLRFLRTRMAHLRRSKTALRQTQAFGAWLVTTARSQQLHRTANRILCNHFKRELWRAWFAWHHYYERTVLIRANNRDLLRKRNEEIERYLSQKGERRSFHAQYSALRDWSLVVKDRKRTRHLLTVWRNTVGRSILRTAWRHWQLLLSCDLIATCIKKIWRGFRVRKLYCEAHYQYLQRFRRNLPLYLRHRRQSCQRKVFALLKRHFTSMRDLRDLYMRRFFLRCATKRLRANALLYRRGRRVGDAASTTHERYTLRTTVHRMLRRHKRIGYVRMLTAAHAVRSQMRAVHLWKCAFQRCIRTLNANAKCRRHFLRKGWKSLRRNCRIATRIRRWRTHRLRVRAKTMLRYWHRSIAYRTQSQLRTLTLYKRRRFQTWFRWWWQQTARHSKRLRQEGVDQRKVFFLKIRGGRHFQVVRGMISARVRWFLKKFIDFTSFRRRNRALLYTLGRSWHKNKLSEAFQRLMLESHRSSRQRRKLKSALGPETVLGGVARRYKRGGLGLSGALEGSFSLPSTGGLLGGMSAPRTSAPPPGAMPLRLPSGSLIFPREVQAPPRMRAPSDVSTLGANSLFNRLSRRQMHQNIRHVVARHVPVSRAEIIKRLQDNTSHTTEHCTCKRGFRLWLQFTRYNRRNLRACKRIDQGFWSITLDNALKHLYTKLLVRRRMKFRARRVLTVLKDAQLRYFMHTLYCTSRRRVKKNHAIAVMDTKWSAKFRKRFFTRMYTICFFRRYARKLKCVRRLRAEVKAAVKKLRFIAWHHLRSPAAQAIKKMDLKKKKLAFKRLRKFMIKGKFRRALGRVAVQQRNTTLAVSALSYLKEYKILKQALQRVVRRFTLVPTMRLWLDATRTQQRDHSAVAALHKRIGTRIRRTVVGAWREFARRSALLRQRVDVLTRKTTNNKKYHVLMTWLSSVDNKINQEKHDRVVELHHYYLLKRGMFHWHKTALISEMCTWRSSKSAVRNWHLSTRISRKLRHSFQRAERFADAYLVTAYILLWYRRVARRILLDRRHSKALRLKQLRKYLTYFRKWKRRMYLVYRERNFLSPLQQNTRLFNLQRSLRIWHRVARVMRRSSKRRILAENLQHWRTYCHKKRFSRIGFLDRLSQFRRKQLITQPFVALVSNCKALRLQRMLFSFTTMTHKSKALTFWRKLYLMRRQEKQSLLLVFKGLYQHNVHRCFRTWRIHVTVFSSLLRRNAVNHAWRNWKLILAARRKYKGTLLRRVLTAWRVYFQSIDAAKLILIRRRRTLWRIMSRKVQSDYLKLAVAVHRMRAGDEDIRLCNYRQYQHLISAEQTAALSASFPLKHLFQEISRSNAGRNLTFSGLLDVSHLSVSSLRRGPAPRLLMLQRKLQERCQAAGGVALGDFDGVSFVGHNHTFGTTLRSPLTATRFHSPPGKISPQRAYTSEAKHSQHHHPQQSPERKHAAAEAQRRGDQLRSHVHTLFSPKRGEDTEIRQHGVTQAHTGASGRRHSPPHQYTAQAESRTPFSASDSVASMPVHRGGATIRHGTGTGMSAGVGAGASREGVHTTAADISYIPAARLFSPQYGGGGIGSGGSVSVGGVGGAAISSSPFASNITPYQPPRQRGTGSLPTGDIHTMQSKAQFLRTREML